VEGQTALDSSRIDAAILSNVQERWAKVAMVIAQVVGAAGVDFPSGDEGCNLVSQRIDALVSDGRLEAQGDTKNWRFSEIRRKSN
jgi:hypothetical protein